MEQGPKIRIIGNASSEKKEEIKKEMDQRLFNHIDSLSLSTQKDIETLGYPKSEKERAVLDFANSETSRLMEEAGIQPYNIPINNFHIIPPGLYGNCVDDTSNAVTLREQQSILFNAERFRANPVYFGAVALHETLHLKAHFSMEVQEEDGEITSTPYRNSVSIHALQSHGLHKKYHIHFDGLHEAIVAETEKKLLGKLLGCPELKQEKEWLESNEAIEKKKEVADEKDIPYEDILWVDKEPKKNYESVSYPQQRNVLNHVCTEIQEQYPEQYQTTDDIYKLFLNAHFTGRLLPIARLVEEVFGEGSFRILGNMDTDSEGGVLCLETLQKSRMRQNRKTNLKTDKNDTSKKSQ